MHSSSKSNQSGFLYKVEKSNVETEFSLNDVQPLRERTELYYSDEGEYTITVKVYLEDKSIYTQKDLTWTYDTSLPSMPIVGFSEKASNDEKVSTTYFRNYQFDG